MVRQELRSHAARRWSCKSHTYDTSSCVWRKEATKSEGRREGQLGRGVLQGRRQVPPKSREPRLPKIMRQLAHEKTSSHSTTHSFLVLTRNPLHSSCFPPRKPVTAPYSYCTRLCSCATGAPGFLENFPPAPRHITSSFCSRRLNSERSCPLQLIGVPVHVTVSTSDPPTRTFRASKEINAGLAPTQLSRPQAQLNPSQVIKQPYCV